MILGMFTLALFAGIVSSTLLRVLINLRGDQFRMSNYTNHIVVIGYDYACNLLLDQLLKETNPAQNELVVFAQGERPHDLAPEFIWVSGNPSKESELDKVRLTHAKTAIVVGSRRMEPAQSDAATIMVVFTIRSYLAKQPHGENRKEPLHVVAEILDPENVKHASVAGANEVIESTRLGFALMAHAALMPGTGTIMTKVASAGAHSLYITPNPADKDTTFELLAK
ncbi:MAG: NAD-binding protein [Deltaproteobacteria bacterium]|nr:NAD-binding protein [Deltaproteobacteria bacterium]MBN2673023.1 NAD-binding protein [Deltaproteobacteria bacterium]